MAEALFHELAEGGEIITGRYPGTNSSCKVAEQWDIS
jgi:hypothetical protein